MEDIVDPPGGREFDVVGMAADLCKDLEGAQPLVVKLLCRARGFDILQVQPHHLSNLVDRHGAPFGVVEPSHVGLGLDEHFRALLIDLAHVLRKVGGGFVR